MRPQCKMYSQVDRMSIASQQMVSYNNISCNVFYLLPLSQVDILKNDGSDHNISRYLKWRSTEVVNKINGKFIYSFCIFQSYYIFLSWCHTILMVKLQEEADIIMVNLQYQWSVNNVFSFTRYSSSLDTMACMSSCIDDFNRHPKMVSFKQIVYSARNSVWIMICHNVWLKW